MYIKVKRTHLRILTLILQHTDHIQIEIFSDRLIKGFTKILKSRGGDIVDSYSNRSIGDGSKTTQRTED